MIGRFFVVGMFMMINLGLAVGMMFAALFLLRPLLVRILSPGQRVALWVVGWISLLQLRILRRGNQTFARHNI